MNANSCSLRQLLMLFCDELEQDQQQRLQSAIRTDVILRCHWRQLLHVAQSAKQGQMIESDSSLLSPEVNSGERDVDGQSQVWQQVAAFIDGALNEPDTEAFEKECWTSPELLSNVIVFYQTHVRQQSSPDRLTIESGLNSSDLRQRIIEFFPAATAATVTQGSSVPIPPQSPESEAQPEAVAIVLRPTVKQRPQKKSLYQPFRLAISIAGMVAIIVVSYHVVNWFSPVALPPNVVSSDRPDISGQSVDSKSNSGALDRVDELSNSTEDQRLANGDASSKGFIENEFEPNPNPDRLRQDQNPNSKQDLVVETTAPNHARSIASDPTTNPNPATVEIVDSLVIEPMDRDALKPDVVDKKSPEITRPAELPTELNSHWEEVEGLVAVRTTGAAIWSGALHDAGLGNGEEHERPLLAMECQVLSLSWAQLSLHELGRLTLSANTSLTIEPVAPGRTKFDSDSRFSTDNNSDTTLESDSSDARDARVLIKLRSGRIAISSAVPGSVILVDSVSGHWSIRIATAETELVVEQMDESAVYVAAGSAIVNGEELKARQKLSQKIDGPTERSTNNKSVRWLHKPEKRFPRKKLADLWLQSENLFNELGHPENIPPADRPLFRSGLATIDPPSVASVFLANELPELRTEGILWLLEYGRNEVHLRNLAADMAAQFALPGLEQMLPRMVIAIHQAKFPQQTDTESLVMGLNHRNPAVRRLSYGLLLHLFGSLVEYNPEAEAGVRNRQSQTWGNALSRLYRRLEEARQR